jgi:hypothetical protein
MAAHAVIAGIYPPHAAPDTADDVGAMHHDMSPDASGISCSGLLFFYEAQLSRGDLEPKSLV